MSDVAKKVVVTGAFVANFVNVFKPKRFDESREPEYSITMGFKKDDPCLKELKRAARYALEEKFGADKDRWPKGLKTPFKDGDDKPEYPGFAGTTYVKAANKNRQPELVDRRGQLITKETEFYSGCIARAEVIAFAYDTKTNKGVSFSLQNVQKIRDGEPLSGARRAKDVFGALPLDDGDDEELDGSDEASDGFDDEEEAALNARPAKKRKAAPPPSDDDYEDDEELPPPPKRRRAEAELW